MSDNKMADRMIHATKQKDRRNWRKMGGANYDLGVIISLVIICIAWYFGAHFVGNPFTFPYLEDVIVELFYSVTDLYVIRNVAITMRRVLTGSLYAFLIGFPIGMFMGYSPRMLQILSPFINSLRQVPIMAWVPLSIVWFGIGDAPTIFMIAFSGIFTIILNTVAGVQDISKDFYNAARSMGAHTLDIVKDIVIPGSLPGVLTGVRLAIGMGWMSVI